MYNMIKKVWEEEHILSKKPIILYDKVDEQTVLEFFDRRLFGERFLD